MVPAGLPASGWKKIYLQPETWHTVLVSSSISPGAPPHPCEPRAHLSSVESDLQGEPWHGGTRLGGQARSGRGGSSHAGAVMVEHLGRPRRRPHPATRPPENAQDRRTGLDPYRGHTPGSARGRRALPTRPRRVHRLEAATERGRGQAKAITRDDFAVILARAGEPRRARARHGNR